jgi:hypothetical protein
MFGRSKPLVVTVAIAALFATYVGTAPADRALMPLLVQLLLMISPDLVFIYVEPDGWVLRSAELAGTITECSALVGASRLGGAWGAADLVAVWGAVHLPVMWLLLLLAPKSVRRCSDYNRRLE